MSPSTARRGSDAAEGPLSGFRVLDLTGPLGVYCTKLMADLGADVVRVEPPTEDSMRRLPPFYRAPAGQEVSLYYLHMNTSKRAVSLDLHQPRGRGLFLGLVEHADVLVETCAPGTLESLDLGYDTLQARNAGLVLTSITPFGQTGPYRACKASDLVGQAVGGLMAITGYKDGTPARLAAEQGYHTAALHACVGTLIALYHREATGQGQRVEASMQEAVALTTQPAVQNWDLQGELLGPQDPRFGSLWRCKDGYVSVALGRVQALERVAEWLREEGVGRGLEAARWDDPAWVATVRPQIVQGLGELLALRTRAEIVVDAQQRRLWLSPVNSAEDILADPQLHAREFFQPVSYPELGVTLTHSGAPFKLSASPWRMAARAPLPGEHNEAVFCGELGLSAAELAELRREGVL